MIKKIFLFLLFLSLSFSFGLFEAKAQGKMALSITPPLIKNNVNPGQIWKSYIKVVNNNNTEIDAYIQLINFESNGETGTVRLTPLDDSEIEGNEYLINNWIHIEEGPIKIPAGTSKEIPFIVDVPEKADPGDHHVAMLVGTKPKDGDGEGSSIKISSMLGSLLLLNVNGDVDVSGVIREFSSDKSIYSNGEATLKVKFQNTGNTILQPRGEITIFNFQDKEQGHIKINHKTNTGNVFPEDSRSWEYQWEVPENLLKMGKYRAEMLLTYGDNGGVDDRTIYFWVIQTKPVAITLGSILFVILLFVWLIKRSIRKAVLRTQKEAGLLVNKQASASSDGVHKVVNLRSDSPSVDRPASKKSFGFKWFFRVFLVLFLALALLLLVFVYFYFNSEGDSDVLLEEVGAPIRNDELSITNDETQNTEYLENDLEEVEVIEEIATTAPAELISLNKDIEISILNGSGKAGMAGIAKERIEADGFLVDSTGNADSFDYKYTIITYPSEGVEEAKALKALLKIEASLEEKEDLDNIEIIIGSDFN